MADLHCDNELVGDLLNRCVDDVVGPAWNTTRMLRHPMERAILLTGYATAFLGFASREFRDARPELSDAEATQEALELIIQAVERDSGL